MLLPTFVSDFRGDGDIETRASSIRLRDRGRDGSRGHWVQGQDSTQGNDPAEVSIPSRAVSILQLPVC